MLDKTFNDVTITNWVQALVIKYDYGVTLCAEKCLHGLQSQNELHK